MDIAIKDSTANSITLGIPTPPWIPIAQKELGISQSITSRTADRIIEYHHVTNLSENYVIDSSTAWCSSFANWVMKTAGYTGTNDAHASSWASWGEPISVPAFGCIGITSNAKGALYHVGFVVGKRTFPPKIKGEVDRIGYLLFGGNQGPKPRHVCLSWFQSTELKTFRIPKGYAELNYFLGDIKGDFSEGSYETTR